MEKKVIRNLQNRVIVLIMLIVAFALTGTSSFGSTFHGYLQNGVMEYHFYATPLTYLLMYLSFVFLALVIFVLVVFLRVRNGEDEEQEERGSGDMRRKILEVNIYG